MRVYCYRTRDQGPVREQLWQLIAPHNGWLSDHIVYTLFYMPSKCVPFAQLIDPELEACPHEDWYL